jgi:hypothetical protein
MTMPSQVTRPVDDVVGRADHHRCPFSTRSARVAELMTACPGFQPQQIRIAVQRDADSGTVTSCHHLQAVPTRRGRFVPACHHPETWVVDAARRLIRTTAPERGGMALPDPDGSLPLEGVSPAPGPPDAEAPCGGARAAQPLAGERRTGG